jgi:MFS family permease
VNIVDKPTRLLNKNFFLLWQGQFVSQLGNQAHAIAMMFWLKRTTESAGVMGLILMLSMLPGVILGPIGGTFADRYSRKKIIVVCDILAGLSVLSLSGVMFLAPEAMNLNVIWLAVVAIILGILAAVFRPAISASIPDLVPSEKLTAANSFNQSSAQISGLIGQGAGGILFRVLGAPVLFLVDGITYLISAFTESFIQIPQKTSGKSENFRELMKAFTADTKEGFRYIWQRKGMRNLFFTATFLNFFLSPIMVLLPFFIEDNLQATPDWFGYFLAAIGAGSMLGYIIAGALKVWGRTRMLVVIIALVLDAMTFGVLGLATDKYMALAIGFLIGFLNGTVNINIITILQITTPSEIRGRVFGVLGTIAGGLMPIGIALAGVIADLAHHNIPAIFIASGGITALCTLIVSISRDFRDFLSYKPENHSGANP